MDARTRASASITQAKTELDRALVEIDLIQTFDPALVGLFAHALSNYITVTSATVDWTQSMTAEFQEIRRELDPQGRLLNGYLKGIFGVA